MNFKCFFFLAATITLSFTWGCDKELPDPNGNGNNNGNNPTADTIYFTVEGIKMSNGVVKDTSYNAAKIVGDFSNVANNTNPIIEHGHVWSKTTNLPVLGNAEGSTQLGPKSNPGIFTSNLTGLTPNSVYYARAYVTTQQGTAYYPKSIQFKTKPNPTPILGFGQFSITSDPNNSNSANPGETLTLDVSIINTGLVDAKAVTAQFVPNAGVQVLSSQPVSYGDIFAGASISKTISIKIDPAVQWNSTVPIYINLKDNLNVQWTSNFNLEVKSPYVVSENLITYYTFENQSMFNIGKVEDISGDSDAAVYGTVSLSTDSPSSSGKSANFPGGVTNYMKIVNDPLGGSISWSLSMWIKTTDSQACLLDGDIDNSGYDRAINFLNGLIVFRGQNMNYVINNSILNNLWHHVVFTNNGASGSIKVYLDGVLFDQDSNTFSYQSLLTNYGTSIGLRITYNSTGYDDYQGKMDNIRLYNRELLLNEVKQIFDAKQ